MSSVAGQIDNVTGGRRMDRIMRACESDLEALATKTGQPKAGGEWSKAVRHAEELREAESRLASQVSELSGALKEHADLQRALRKSDDPEAAKSRNAAISSATQKLEMARNHARKISEAGRDLRLAELEARGYRDQIEISDAAERQKHARELAESTAHSDALQADSDAATTGRAVESALGILKQARQDLQDTRQALSEAQARKEHARAAQRHRDITVLLGKVANFEEIRNTQAGLVRDNPVTQEAMQDIEDLAQSLSTARALREAGAGALRMTYTGTDRILADNIPLPQAQDIPLTRNIHLDIPGIGQMDLTPARSSGAGADPEQISGDLKDHLATLGVASLIDARKKALQRREAVAAESLARQSIETLTPDGTDSLRRELADIGDVETNEACLEETDLASLHARVAACEENEQGAISSLETARETHARAIDLATEARTRLRLAKEQATSPPDGLLSPRDYLRISQLMVAADQKTSNIRRSVRTLEDTAPDTESAEAELERLTSARDNAAREREDRIRRLHALGGVIQARAEDNVESKLAEIRGALEKVEAREARYRFEVDALTELARCSRQRASRQGMPISSQSSAK